MRHPLTHAERDKVEAALLDINADLLAALQDVLECWPTECGMDGAIKRARAAIAKVTGGEL